jgi:ribosomal protein S12 methylthiotransferase
VKSTPPSPRVGFVSLGCPKALVDSEQILTRLRAEGYEIAPDYQGADLVVVNTCGFIDAAVEESLDAIGEALRENGKVIVTGCLGAQGERVLDAHPRVLAVTGPHAAAEVMDAVHQHLPAPHDPFTSLVPPQGIRLTPKHFAYLKISEGCNHRCTFCIIPSMRGDLVSRPVGEVMREAEALVKAGVRELLVISQDTSAYGVDLRYRTGFWDGRPLRTHSTELARALATLGVWVRLHYVYPYPHVDDLIPLMVSGQGEPGLLPYLDVPFQHASPRILKLMKRPAAAEQTLQRLQAWRRHNPELTVRRPRRNSPNCWISCAKPSWTGWGVSPIPRSTAPAPMRCPIRCRRTSSRSAWPASWKCRNRSVRIAFRAASGVLLRFWSMNVARSTTALRWPSRAPREKHRKSMV